MASLRQLVDPFRRDDVLGLAAELAYRFFLAIFPFFLFLAALGQLLTGGLGVPNPAPHFAQLLGQIMPPDASALFQAELEYVLSTYHPGLASLGFASALWVATGGTTALMKGLNRAYEVEETRPFLRRHLLALGLTMLAGSAVGSAFLLLVGGRWFGERLAASWGLQDGFAQGVDLLYWPLVGLLLTGAVAVLYRLAPNRSLRWRAALPGAVLFTVSWMAATGLFAWWAEQLGTYRLAYGTLAGVVALLLWFYLTAFCLLTGAEINAQLDPEWPRPQAETPPVRLDQWARTARGRAERLFDQDRRSS
jgi:membrane protein